MDASGRPVGGRRGYGPEPFLLHLARRLVVEVVEPGFADADDPRVVGQCRDHLAVRDPASPALCGWTPTVPQTFGERSASACTCRDWANVVPMVTIRPTPAAVARADDVRDLGVGEVVEVAVAIDQHQMRQAAGST